MNTPRIIPEAQMTPSLDAAIKAALCACFPNDAAIFQHTRAWHGSVPAFSVIVQSEGQVIAHAGIVDRTLLVADRPLRVAGLQNVCVLPSHRGQHLSTPLLVAAMDEARRLSFDAGLLFCLPHLEPLYRRLGWIALPATVFHATRLDGARYTLDNHNLAMYLPLRLPTFPPGPVDLRADDW